MASRWRNVRRIFVELPAQLRLGYCLMRDPRVPAGTKLAFGAGLGLLVTPRPLPRSLPFLGEFDMAAVTVLALKLFIRACPDDVVADVEQAILEQRSVFDSDVRAAENIAISLYERFRPETPLTAKGQTFAQPLSEVPTA